MSILVFWYSSTLVLVLEDFSRDDFSREKCRSAGVLECQSEE